MRKILMIMMMCGLVASVARGGDGEREGTRGGVLEGVVVKKDGKSITVHGDDRAEPMTFIPEWRGGMPKDGGGPDRAMVETLSKIGVGSRVRVTWHFEEHNRVTAIEVLKPVAQSGKVTGEVVKAEKKLLVIRSEGKLFHFTPVWSGGMPKDGGGLDKAMMERLAKVKPGEVLTVEWTYDERPRVVDFERAK